MIVGGDPDDLRLAGHEGTADGTVLTLRGGERPPSDRWLLWSDGHGAPPQPDPDRLLAPAGEGLWRRAPWPAADALFELPAPRDPTHVLAITPDDADSTAEALDRLAATIALRPRLTADDLEWAGIVVLGPGADDSLPVEGIAPLAAGRLVITRGCTSTFGLQDGFELLACSDAQHAAMAVDAALSAWDAFAAMRALGRLAAERHRASRVYERIVADLALESSARLDRVGRDR